MTDDVSADIRTDGDVGAFVRSNFLTCPTCDGDDVVLHIWGENVDSEIECESCEAVVHIR